MKLSTSGIDHLNELSALLEKLHNADIALFEHNYLMHVFGSFTLVLGRAHKRLKFSWDGRDYFLDVSASEFQNTNSSPNWEHFMNKRVEKGEGLFDEIYSISTNVFAV